MTIFRSVLLPFIAVALVLGASLVTTDDEQARPPGVVDVTQTSYACPTDPTLTIAAGQVAAGTTASASVLPGRTPQKDLADASRWREAKVDGKGVVVQQRGRASGAVGYYAGTARASDGGGLVVGSCPGVVDDAWLMGLGSGSKHFSTLVLTNLADSTAAVDLTLWGPKGKIDAVDADGIVVEPNSVRRIRLDSLAAGESEITVHVHRTRGSLAAVVDDTSRSTFAGTEPIVSTLSPRRRQVVGGLVAGTSGRTLMILNPGDVTARVDAEVIARKRTFAPSGLQDIKVDPGTVKYVTVPESAGSDQQAMRLTSDQPVSASVRMSPGTKDYAYAEATVPLTGPAVVPVRVGSAAVPPQLVLTAPDRRASVEVETFDADMKSLSTTTVAIPAGTTKVAKPKGSGAAYVVLRPRGDVVAAATYVKGDGLSSLAVTAAPITVLAPQVRPVG